MRWAHDYYYRLDVYMWRFQLLFQSRIQKKNLNKWHEIARNMKLWVRGTWNIYNLFGYWGTWRATLACKSFFLSIPLLVFFYPYLSSCRSPMKRMASCVYYLAGKLPKTPFHSFAQMKWCDSWSKRGAMPFTYQISIE